MRFIRGTNQGILGVIAGEMLNQEYGKKLFHEGKYIDTPVHETASDLCFDGVKVLIKPNFGLLYVDDRVDSISDDYIRWVKLLTTRIETLAKEISPVYTDRSKQFTTVDCGEDGFTSMKIKIPYSGTKYLKESAVPPKSTYERVIYAAQMAQITTFREKIGIARFTWIVYPLSRIYHGISAASESPDAQKALLSYLTLVYDPSYVIRDCNNPMNDTIRCDLTLNDIKYVKQVLPLFSAGELTTDDLINRLKPKREDPKRRNANGAGTSSSNIRRC